MYHRLHGKLVLQKVLQQVHESCGFDVGHKNRYPRLIDKPEQRVRQSVVRREKDNRYVEPENILEGLLYPGVIKMVQILALRVANDLDPLPGKELNIAGQ